MKRSVVLPPSFCEPSTRLPIDEPRACARAKRLERPLPRCIGLGSR
jgi:hypothetical protein